jgi:heme/copper-type cytochrome/quinol oxidase subunit 2
VSEAVRRLFLLWENAVLLIAIMFLGSLALWVGVPLGWLWVGSRIQAKTDSVGFALLTMMTGMVVSVALLIVWLSWLNRKHVELQEVRGRTVRGSTALEHVLVASGAVALLVFTVWFFGFSGSSPVPLNIGY